MKALFDQISMGTSKLITKSYSTSFSMGILGLDSKFHNPIYAVYGYVRLADEIVDSFHDFNKEELLDQFERDTFEALEKRISLNPVLNSFQEVVHQFNIEEWMIRTFLKSMRMDLSKIDYNQVGYEEYILGSAEVVGLMCLKVFVEGNQEKYEELEYNAKKLGSAFQKINFLRDLSSDYHELGRVYFPGVDMSEFNENVKFDIEQDIMKDFKLGFEGIMKLPKGARFGVYIAYVYYFALFKKIMRTPANVVFRQRIRIPDNKKYQLFLSSYLRHSLNLL